MKKSKELFIYSIVILFVALCDLVRVIIQLFKVDFNMFANEEALLQAVGKTILIIAFVISFVSIIIGIYLGAKGIAESRKTSGSRLHIVIGKFVAILNVILAICLAIALFNSKNLLDDIFSFVIALTDVIIMFSYVSTAKAVRNGEKISVNG